MYPPPDPAQLAAFQAWQQQQQQQLRLAPMPAYPQPPQPLTMPYAQAPYAQLPAPLPRPRRARVAAPDPDPAEPMSGSLWVILVSLLVGAAGGAACERHFHPVAAAAAVPAPAKEPCP